MGTRTEHAPGTFSWVDLATGDLDAAKAFYSDVLGWRYEDVPTSGGNYSMAYVGDHVVGAVYASEQGPPHWNNYVTVESADATAERARELGATLPMEPFDVMDVGRMGVIQDPVGAVLAVWEPRGHVGAALVNAPGALCWNELSTTDTARAAQFYRDLFGWTTDQGRSDYLHIHNQGRQNGGITAQGAMEGRSFWLAYFAVADLAGARETARGRGASVYVEDVDVGMGRIAVLADPQGAPFALYAGELDD